MSSMAALPDSVGSADAVSAAGRRISGLLRAFWYRTKDVAAPVFRVTSGIMKVVAVPVMLFATPPVVTLAYSGMMSTRWGREGTGAVLSGIGRGFAWIVRKVALGVHKVIDWVGHGVASLVDVFSPSAGASVHDAVNSFGQTREILGGWVRQRVSGAYERICYAAGSQLVHGVVMATALTIAGLVLASLVAPLGFAAALAALPLSPWVVGQIGVLVGGTTLLDMALLAGAFVISTMVSLVAQLFEPMTEEEAVEAIAEAQAEQPKKVTPKRAAARETVTEQVTEETVHIITDVAESEVIPGVTPVTEENRAAEVKAGEADFHHGPGRRKPKRK